MKTQASNARGRWRGWIRRRPGVVGGLMAALFLVASGGQAGKAMADQEQSLGHTGGGPTGKSPKKLPIWFHVVVDRQGQPAAEGPFLKQQLTAANRIFAPYGVQFVWAGKSSARPPANIEHRADRDGLASQVREGVINCFVVASLRDVDEPARMRFGVHWHARPQRKTHYVILSVQAPEAVLAHELGHYLGNRAHSKVRGNLMSYDWAGQMPVLNKVQQRRMRARIHRYFESGELVEAKEPKRPAPPLP